MTCYERLVQPGAIGSLQLPNRAVMAPMGTGYADESGMVTEQLIAYHVARARGGVGLSITEHTVVRKDGLTTHTMLALYDDAHIPGFRELCRAVHDAGGRIAAQLNHGGRQADADLVGELVAPSEHPSPSGTATARALGTDEIAGIVAAYGSAAARAKEAGIDGIEVHMAHGYLGCSFLSPLTNRRTDRYGGDTHRRCRFGRDVFAEIQRLCGGDFPVWCRISADEFIEGGMTLDEAKKVAPLLQEAGAQAVHVSGGVGETAHYAAASYYEPLCNLADLAAGIKEVVDVPVIAVGRILTPDLAETLLSRGVCDFIALGRPLLADPEWPDKAGDGRPEDIIPCIACNIGCLTRRMPPAGITFCLTNPLTGREHEWPGTPEAAPGRVLVIGGGPGGMAAAAAFADIGHEVELWEATEELGGAYRLACRPPGKQDLRPFLEYQIRRLTQTGVVVRLDTRATADRAADFAPDIAIVATGAHRPLASRFLNSGVTTLFAEDALRAPSLVGERVAVVGAGRAGTETAHFLAERDRSVTLVEAGDAIARDIPSGARTFLEERLQALGVRILCGVKALEAHQTGLAALDIDEDAPLEVEADTIVLALPRRPAGGLASELRAAGIPIVEVIGDAKEPRCAQEAVYEGARSAQLLANDR